MDFYRINEEYIKFLQKYEKEKRGITKVPNIRYEECNKFAFGAVVWVNGIKYYVSVSSFTKKQEANILLRVPGDEKEVKGSLRFNYMVPVPDGCIERLIIKEIEDKKYRLLVNKEFQFCQNHAEQIQKKAEKIYKMVTTNRKPILTENSCSFHILEDAYREYIEKYLGDDFKGKCLQNASQKSYDCAFTKGNHKFRFRTGGIMIKDNKMLFVKSNFGNYYYMIGGAVQLGETTEKCIEREVFEEAGIKVQVERLAVVCENFFQGIGGAMDGFDCHTMEFYYLLKVQEDEAGVNKKETDEGEELVWLPMEEIPDSEIKPSFIKEYINEIMNGDKIIHIIWEKDR